MLLKIYTQIDDVLLLAWDKKNTHKGRGLGHLTPFKILWRSIL